MRSSTKKPYEISLWEDQIVYVLKDGKEVTELKTGMGAVETQYFREQKITIIGSDKMDSPIKVFSPKINMKTDGSLELTFSLYSHYYDDNLNILLDNPFKALLTNERKVKMRIGSDEQSKWYDFVIKEIVEDSDSKIFTYIAKSLFINELSKTGFNLQFNIDLENNIGNLPTLADAVLNQSDWKLSPEVPVLQQLKEEPLYEIKLAQDIEAKNMEKGYPGRGISKNSTIYVFYNVLAEEENFFQFIYCDNYQSDDDKLILNKHNNYYIEVTYSEDGLPQYKGSALSEQTKFSISDDYRGKKLVRKQVVKYDKKIDKYVSVYTDKASSKEVYGYTQKEYLSSNFVYNFLTNNQDFDSVTGWKEGEFNGDVTVQPALLTMLPVMIPDIRDLPQGYQGEQDSFLFIKTQGSKSTIFNSGIIDNRSRIGDITEGESFLFRIKFGVVTAHSTKDPNRPYQVSKQDRPFNFCIAPYKLDSGHYLIDKAQIVFAGSRVEAVEKNGYYEIEVKSKRSVPYKEMLEQINQLGFFFRFEQAGEYAIEEIQFFRKVSVYEEGVEKICYPNEDIKSQMRTKFLYYDPNNANYKDKETVAYLYKDYIPSTNFVPKYNNDTFEKVRMLTSGESNRFNLLQELCELFECWVKFDVEHDPLTGRILLGKDKDPNCSSEEKYRQQKWVHFYESVEKPKQCGFVYGINLKAIKRNVQSDGIISKIVVKNNSNPAAKDGFCSIARADENFARENFVYDFSYYINQGMLSSNVVYNDLYSGDAKLDVEGNFLPNAQGHLGYYKKLHYINVRAQKVIEEQSILKTQFDHDSSDKINFEVLLEKSQEELINLMELIKAISSYSYEDLKNSTDSKVKEWRENEKVWSTYNSIINLQKKIEIQQALLTQAQKRYDETSKKIEKNEKFLKDCKKLKDKCHLEFYKKYSRFIQEGSWISEDYSEDNLYYLDAENTLYTSAQPQVKYTIDVLELSQIEGYENYSFELGDKTYIQDTEFFGWITKNGARTPYREEIIVTEIDYDLDNPEKTRITVQNYKAQFEDLFQRITSTTQSVQFHTGEYKKAANIVEPNGEIKFDTLQNSMANSSLIIKNAQNQSVFWDDSGITTTSINSPNEIVRIVSGGVFVSEDGGQSWTAGITGKGVSASTVTTGLLNTQKITIGSGAFPSFRWDEKGINAFQFETDEITGSSYNYNYANFIRLDQFGLYGIRGNSNFDATVKDGNGNRGIQKIIKNADFSLTWEGFSLRSSHTDGGYISLTSQEDLIVYNKVGKNEVKKIIIGRLDAQTNHPHYGIQINNNAEQPVIKQSEDGSLWIKNELLIGQETSTVRLGYLSATSPTDGNNHEVIHAGNNSKKDFVVYEDGTAVANYIEARGGKIGNVSISDISQTLEDTKTISILSPSGTIFKLNNQGQVSPEVLTLKIKTTGFTIEDLRQIVWSGSSNLDSWEILVSGADSCVISWKEYSQKFANGSYFIKVSYQNYEAYCTLNTLTDGEIGVTPLQIQVVSDKGDIFVNGEIYTTLRVKVYQDGEDITSNYADNQFVWKKFFADGQVDEEWNLQHQNSGKTVAITDLDIDKKAIFSCELTY